MYKEIDTTLIDSLTLKHTVIANFGFLLANTIDKNFNHKLDINMRNLTSYLIESEIIDVNDLKEIIRIQSDFGLNKHYHFTKMYEGDEITEPTLLFQISNIVMNLDQLFFKKNINKILNNFIWYRKKITNKPILEIYTSYFNIVKLNSYFYNNMNHHRDIKIVQEKLIEAIDFHYHPSENQIFTYEPINNKININTLQEKNASLLHELCEYIHIFHTSFERETLNNLTKFLYLQLKEYKDNNNMGVSQRIYFELFRNYLHNTNNSIEIHKKSCNNTGAKEC